MNQINDSSPLNSKNSKNFEIYGIIDSTGIEDIYRVEGIGWGLANESGIYFLGNNGGVVKNVGELKSLYKFKTGKDIQPLVINNFTETDKI